MELSNEDLRELIEAVASRTGGQTSVEVSGREPYLSLSLCGQHVSIFPYDEETVEVSVGDGPDCRSARVSSEEWAMTAIVRALVLEPPV